MREDLSSGGGKNGKELSKGPHEFFLCAVGY